MALHPRRHLARNGESPQIADDESVNPRRIQRPEEVRQLGDVAIVHEDVAGNVHLHPMGMGEGHRFGNLGQWEIGGTSPHAETIGRQVHGVGAEQHRRPQLLHAPCGGQKFHSAQNSALPKN